MWTYSPASMRRLPSSRRCATATYGGWPVLSKFGLDDHGLRARDPRRVYCPSTVVVQTVPYADRAGDDFMIQGMGAIMDLTGDAEGGPQKIVVAYVDIVTGVYATVAILAALRDRDIRGRGSHIDMSLLDCQVGVLANQAMNFLASGQTPRRLGNAHPNIAPYQTFAAEDGHQIGRAHV